MTQNYSAPDLGFCCYCCIRMCPGGSVSVLLTPWFPQFRSWDNLHKREFVSEGDSPASKNMCPVALGPSIVCSIRNLPTDLPLISGIQHMTGVLTLWRMEVLDACASNKAG